MFEFFRTCVFFGPFLPAFAATPCWRANISGTLSARRVKFSTTVHYITEICKLYKNPRYCEAPWNRVPQKIEKTSHVSKIKPHLVGCAEKSSRGNDPGLEM